MTDQQRYPVTARPTMDEEKQRYKKWEERLSTKEIPRTDSIQELAQFWDSHDLTDFAEGLEEVSELIGEAASES